MSAPSKPRSFSSGRGARERYPADRPLVSSSVHESAADLSSIEFSDQEAKLLLIPFRSGEAVSRHPEVLPYLSNGWRVRSASPRITPEGTKLLVVLE